MWGMLGTASIPTGTKQPFPTNSHRSLVLCEKQPSVQARASLQRTFTEGGSLGLIMVHGAGQHRVWAMSCFLQRGVAQLNFYNYICYIIYM